MYMLLNSTNGSNVEEMMVKKKDSVAPIFQV